MGKRGPRTNIPVQNVRILRSTVLEVDSLPGSVIDDRIRRSVDTVQTTKGFKTREPREQTYISVSAFDWIDGHLHDGLEEFATFEDAQTLHDALVERFKVPGHHPYELPPDDDDDDARSGAR